MSGNRDILMQLFVPGFPNLVEGNGSREANNIPCKPCTLERCNVIKEAVPVSWDVVPLTQIHGRPK